MAQQDDDENGGGFLESAEGMSLNFKVNSLKMN